MAKRGMDGSEWVGKGVNKRGETRQNRGGHGGLKG